MSTEIYKSREDQLMRRTARPLTPGEFTAGMLDELNISQAELARRIGVSHSAINRFIQGKRPITPDLAHRLGRFFGNSAMSFLAMQATVQMWDALHMDQSAYESIEPVRAEAGAVAA